VTARQAHAFYEVQMRSRVDLDLARATLSPAQLDAAQADAGVLTAATQLGQALGFRQDAEYVLDPPDPNVPN
jgi:outer membrane protein TolC